MARTAYRDDRLERVSIALGFPHDHVIGVARDCPNAEAFATRIVPEPPAGMRIVPLAVAEDEIARLVCGQVAA